MSRSRSRKPRGVRKIREGNSNIAIDCALHRRTSCRKRALENEDAKQDTHGRLCDYVQPHIQPVGAKHSERLN